MKRPPFIKHYEEIKNCAPSSYPGDTETFGITKTLGRAFGLERIAINYEILSPGDRTSWPHAHSREEEFIFILEGTPELWIDGHLYPLSPGDCAAFNPGKGHAHTLINNNDQEVRALVIGERKVVEDKIFYPKHPQRNEEMREKGCFWENHPLHPLGEHDGCSNRKKKD